MPPGMAARVHGMPPRRFQYAGLSLLADPLPSAGKPGATQAVGSKTSISGAPKAPLIVRESRQNRGSYSARQYLSRTVHRECAGNTALQLAGLGAADEDLVRAR